MGRPLTLADSGTWRILAAFSIRFSFARVCYANEAQNMKLQNLTTAQRLCFGGMFRVSSITVSVARFVSDATSRLAGTAYERFDLSLP